LDKNSAERYEYFDGVVVDMAGGSLNHNRITRNVIRSLENTLEGSGCEVLPSEMRLNTDRE
jgi:Uma2 family endonuclease